MHLLQFTKLARILMGVGSISVILMLFGCGRLTSTNNTDVPIAPPTTEMNPLTEGSGRTTTNNSTVVITYTGFLEDGTEIDKSENDGFCFKLGSGKVLKPIESRLVNQREGAEIELNIPPNEAYGDTGLGSLIPPNATLNYKLKLISVLPDYLRLSSSPSISFTEIVTDDFAYVDIEEGDGLMIFPASTSSPSISSTQIITEGFGHTDIEEDDGTTAKKVAFVHYTCWNESQGQIKSTIRPRSEVEADICQPFMVPIEEKDTVRIPLSQAMVGMKKGGERFISISGKTPLDEGLKSQLGCESQTPLTIYLFLSEIK